MTYTAAYWILNDVLSEITNDRQKEAIKIAMDCVEYYDLMVARNGTDDRT